MRRISHIALAAVLAAMCVLPAAGQNYRKNKVHKTDQSFKTEPRPLILSRTIKLSKPLDPDWNSIMYGWNCDRVGVGRVTYCNSFGANYILYTGKCYGLVANKEVFNLWMELKLYYEDNQRLDLVASDIRIFSKKDIGEVLSAEDNRNNRPWLWLVFHDIDTVDKERVAAKDYFNTIADSIEEFFDPPMELQRIN